MIQLVRRLGVEAYLAAGNVLVALVLGLGAFRLLPVRSIGVTAPAVLLMALLVASAVGLATRSSWASRVTRATGIALLLAGVLAGGALTLGATFSRRVIASSAGPVLYLFIALLVLPYTVFYGSALLLWLRFRERAS